MAFRLRYLQHDLELTEGEFAVGRNASCQLSLDDPLVSRRHAILTVTREGVRLEDLNSRNGVLVNGRRMDTPRALHAGDVITIGSQEMVLVEARHEHAAHVTSALPKATLPKVETVPPVSPDDQSLSFSGVMIPAPSAIAETDLEDTNMLRRVDGFRVLGGVAEKALGMGRTDDAERMLASALADVIEACRGGQRIPASLAEQAGRLSAKLATATGKGAWADYVIELYSARARPAPAQVIDELYNAFRKVSSVDVVKLRDYVERLRAELPRFGPADRFLFQRIEGLARLAVLR